MGRLFQASVEATRCEHFGLLAGQGLNLQSLGIVGQLMLTAPNLHFALWDLALTQARNADGAVCYLRRMEQFSVVGYAIYQPGVPAIDQIIDGARARTKSRIASCPASGIQMGVSSPARCSLASIMASRRSVFTRSPAFIGISDGATTTQSCPSLVSKRCSPYPQGPAS